MEFFQNVEGKNNNDNYLDEISIIQKNEELIKKGNELQNNNNNNPNVSTGTNIKNQSNSKDASLINKNSNKLNSNKKQYIKIYDYFQNKLNEFSKRTKRRCF